MCQQPMRILSLFVLWIWSSFLLLWAIRKGDVIFLQELGQHVNLLLHAGAFRIIALTTVCALAHFSFVLLLLGVILGTLGILLRLVLVSLLLRWIFSFFSFFLNLPLSLQQPRHVLSLCPLNLILLPSSLTNREGRCYSSLGVGSTCPFSFSYKSS